MATITTEKTAHGYCLVDKENVAIPVRYSSFPRPMDEKGYRTFTKSSNLCEYLRDGRCSLGNNCEVYKNALAEFTQYVGKV